MATDQLARLREVMADWRIEGEARDTPPALDALRRAIRDSRETQLRAAQVVVSGGVGDRGRSTAAMKRLREIPEVGQFVGEPLLVRAMVIAAWPDAEQPIAGLVVAPWEAPARQEEPFQEVITAWRGRLARCASKRHEEPPPVVVPMAELESAEVAQALQHLSNTNTGWAFGAYRAQLVCVMTAMVSDTEAVFGNSHGVTAVRERVGSLNANFSAGTWADISGDFLPAMERLSEQLQGVGGPSVIGPDYQHLVAHRATGWNYDASWAPSFFRLLSTFRDGIIRVRREAALRSTIERSAARLRLDIAAAQRPEVDLLWWGEARYCHTRGLPFRKLKPWEQIWLAAEEAASRAEQLSAAPAAAYLARVLEELGHAIRERKPVMIWVDETWEWLREPRPSTEPRLANLAKADPTGLPVSRLLAAVATGDRLSPDDLRALHVNPDALIDLGDWAGWIFHERLLARRLA